MLPAFGPAVGVEVLPDLNSEHFDKHFTDIGIDNDKYNNNNNNNNDTDDSWDSEKELSVLESFPGRSPPGSDNEEADDDAPVGEHWQVA